MWRRPLNAVRTLADRTPLDKLHALSTRSASFRRSTPDGCSRSRIATEFPSELAEPTAYFDHQNVRAPPPRSIDLIHAGVTKVEVRVVPGPAD
jgi:hypothetical protein